MAVATGHIDPRVGNFLLIGLVGGIGALSILAIGTYLASKKIPGVSPAADALLDTFRKGAAAA
jgi:hypothetical protein